MKDYIEERAIEIANFIIEEKCRNLRYIRMLPNGSSRLTPHLPRRHARCLIPINLSGISGVEWLRERNIFISMDRTEKCKAEADCAENVQLLPLFERNHNCHKNLYHVSGYIVLPYDCMGNIKIAIKPQ